MPQVDVLILETFNSLQQAVCRSCCSGPLEDKDSTSTEQQLSSNPAPRELIGGRGNSYLYTEGLGIAFIWDLCFSVWIFMEKLIRGVNNWWRSIYWHSDCEKRIITMEKQSMNLTYQTQVFAQRVLSLKGNVALRIALGLHKKGWYFAPVNGFSIII